jgi:predicted lipoprotein with Yx(FWY)xxD motif
LTTDNQLEEHMRNPTSRRALVLRSGTALFAAAVGLLVLAGCGAAVHTAAASGPSASSKTVTVRQAGGMSVLATSSGQTLYASDQEKGKVLCRSSACVAVWQPLTVSAQQQPTSSGVAAVHLSTIKRQDGARQVSFDGQPLYTFSFDHSPGQVNGDGQNDSFDGTDFTWHAATPTGASPTSGSSKGSGYSY